MSGPRLGESVITIRKGLTNQYVTVSTEEYKRRGAELMMANVDRMPPELRALVHEFGPVHPPRLWFRGIRGAELRELCEQWRVQDEREAQRSAGIKP